ncbi:RCC1/BLIP-II [Clavulina sp. PMI_390]|nr:RCC1/BLIP-II [Clavulina sp. PMI_390]
MWRTAARTTFGTTRRRTAVLVAGASAVAIFNHSLTQKVQNDEPAPTTPARRNERFATVLSDQDILDKLVGYSWGSGGTSNTGASSSDSAGSRYPTENSVLSGVALRDLVLHEQLNALVDASGDVYRFSSSSTTPTCVLKGKDIKRIAISGSRIFALSHNGQIFSLDISSSETTSKAQPASWLSYFWATPDNRVLMTSTPLASRERFTSLSAGRDHLVALTTSGRTFTHPVTYNANSHGQLGTRKVQVATSTSSQNGDSPTSTIELAPKSQLDPYALSSPFVRAGNAKDSTPESPLAPVLYEVPSLRGIVVDKAVAGERSSYVLTKDGGRVLAWGANEYGQLGLGGTTVVPVVSVPAEVPLKKSLTGSTSKCTDIAAGGNVAYFSMEGTDADGKPSFDLLACGMGQFGALGNASYTQAQGFAIRTKILSGNVFFNEKTNTVDSMKLHTLSASPTGHALASLSSGQDLFTWGSNSSYQLGNGKRANLAVPTLMRDFRLVTANAPESLDETTDRQGRMSLKSGVAKEVKDLSGKRWRKNVKVEQCAVAGWNASATYWRIVDA